MNHAIETDLYKEEVTSVSTTIATIIMTLLAAFFLSGVISELFFFLHDPFTWAVFTGLFLLTLIISISQFLRRKLKITITSEALTLAFGFKRRTVLFNEIKGWDIDKEFIKSYRGQGIRVKTIDGKRTIIFGSTKSPRVMLDLMDGEYGRLVFSTRQPDKIASILAENIK